jgi:beta-glucanase (GH16 family)
MRTVRTVRTVGACTLGACAVAALVAIACTATRPATRPGWTLVWHDEFDAPAGASFDTSRWVADTGGGGWGNDERQRYTTDPSNVAHDGAGHLVVTARPAAPADASRCWYGRCRFTSARLTTQGRFATTYGRIEARLRIPRGQGIWPAFWMLGEDLPRVGWPASGEIDVMENVGREPAVVHGTVHGPGYSGAGGIGGADTLAQGAYADAFHVYAVEWAPAEIRWFVDDRPYFRLTPDRLPAGARWVFDHPHVLLLNVAVGGRWPGEPDATTPLPQRMLVDWVRVWRRRASGTTGAGS